MDRLARDSKAAMDAGMSYGKWKALHPYTEHEEKDDGTGRLCIVCGKKLYGHQRLYCGHNCYQKKDYDKKKVKRAAEYATRKIVIKRCPVCGAEFDYPARRKYCSDKCAKEVRVNRQREYSLDRYHRMKNKEE